MRYNIKERDLPEAGTVFCRKAQNHILNIMIQYVIITRGIKDVKPFSRTIKKYF